MVLSNRTVDFARQAAQRHPYLANAIFAAILGAAGDIGSQVVEKRQEGLELQRTARFSAYRLCVWGPFYSAFVVGLDRVIGSGSTPGLVAAKIFADQLVWTPPSCSMYVISMNAMEGHPFQEGLRRAFGEEGWDGAVWRILRLNWPFWSIAHVITYMLIPLKFRVFFVSGLSVFWNGVISQIYQKAREASAEVQN
eukprot:TRINITY_DN12315_c0_g4_i1.p1 TRINITY_DN12315_c0_g4~~TRINITY_DN12315_c0_g4_i1.p1  ORF type:complete len:226 (-),score=44.78 TRINITY_DN12315_c0_g4_i1:603-1187(-)